MIEHKLDEVLVADASLIDGIDRQIVERTSLQYLLGCTQKPSSSAIASIMLKGQRLMPQFEQDLLESIILDNAPVVQQEMLSKYSYFHE